MPPETLAPASEPPTPLRRARTKQVALGVFICWQLWFLFSQNLFGLLEDSQEHLRPIKDTIEVLAPGFAKDEGQGHVFDLTKWVAQTNKPWAHLTGQAQSWGLFSGWYNDCAFPSMVLLWDDSDPLTYPWPPFAQQTQAVWEHGPLWAASNPLEAIAATAGPLVEKEKPLIPPLFIPTHQEPEDFESYVRWWEMRLRRYETSVVITLENDYYHDFEDRMAYFERRITKHLSVRGYLVRTYMKFRYGQLKPAWEGLPPPKQVLLVQHRYRACEPETAPPFIRGPYTTPLLLWRPPAEGEKGSGTFIPYHAPSNSFKEPR